VNLDMRSFGFQVTGPKAIARTPELPPATGPRSVTLDSTRIWAIVVWQGAKVQNVVGLDEVSVVGTPSETGVIVLDVPAAGPAAKAEITAGEVILGFNSKPVKGTQGHWHTHEARRGLPASIAILRYWQTSKVSIARE
jgi:predicted metalloprotease with PDZ domain